LRRELWLLRLKRLCCSGKSGRIKSGCRNWARFQLGRTGCSCSHGGMTRWSGRCGCRWKPVPSVVCCDRKGGKGLALGVSEMSKSTTPRTRSTELSVPVAHESTSHGSSDIGAIGLGLPALPFTKDSKSTSPLLLTFVAKPLAAARLCANEAVCCSTLRTSRRCCECSCSTRAPNDLMTLEHQLRLSRYARDLPHKSTELIRVQHCGVSHLTATNLGRAYKDPSTLPTAEARPTSQSLRGRPWHPWPRAQQAWPSMLSVLLNARY
jgi:hypothetical protein